MRIFRQLNFRGKGYITNFININSNNTIIANCKGINFKIDFSDAIQKQIYFNIYELGNLETVVNLVKPGWICFDVGANVGAYSLGFAKRLNFKGDVYAFEPEPMNYLRLNENCSLNDFASVVKTFEEAVTNYNGKATLHLSGNEQSGWHSLTEFKDIAKKQIEVRAIKLDTFISNNSIKKIDLIKVDVEANEFELLEGAKECLENQIFKFIFIEFNGPRLAEKHRTFSEFREIFKANGYNPVKIKLELIEDIKKRKVDPSEICENFLFELTGNSNNERA